MGACDEKDYRSLQKSHGRCVMNIVIVTHIWKGHGPGGTENYIINLVEALKKRGIKVRVVFNEGDDPENFKVGGSRFLFPIKAFLILRKIKPQVIYSQGTWYCLFAGHIYKKLYGTTLVHTFHTEPDKKLPVLGKIFFQFLLNGCDCVTFVSKGLRERVEEVYGLRFKKTAITYAGVQAKEVSEREIKEFRERFNIKEDSTVLLALGLTALKHKAEGAKLLIKTVRKLRDKYPNIILILTKEGVYSNELKEFTKNEGVYENVIFTGNVDNTHVPLFICDIYTHITLGEGGVSLALLEAMSVGKPIIASSVGGIPEAIEDGKNGILVEPDVDKIIEKIEDLLENKEFAKELGRNAKKTAEEKFTWGKSVDKFLELYRSL